MNEENKALMGYEEESAAQAEGQADARDARKPQLNVKFNGNYVGRGWLQEGKFGKYVSLSLNQDVPAGSKVFISPNRHNERLLG